MLAARAHMFICVFVPCVRFCRFPLSLQLFRLGVEHSMLCANDSVYATECDVQDERQWQQLQWQQSNQIDEKYLRKWVNYEQ